MIKNKTQMPALAKRSSRPARVLWHLAVVVMLASCATGRDLEVPPSTLPSTSNLPVVPAPVETPADTAAVGTVTPAQTNDAVADGPLDGAPITRESIRDPRHALARRIVFFDYNSAQLDEESIELLALHAQYLSNFRDVRVRLEGHTDERGSREYNIALGDNRARAVARILSLQGVDAGQFSTLSYGEEVPLDEGNSESSYRRNRRVELVYEGLS